MTWNIWCPISPILVSISVSRFLVFSVRSLDILRARRPDWGIMIYAYSEQRGGKNNLCLPPPREALCSPVFIFSSCYIFWRLSDIYHQSLFETSHSLPKSFLISDSTSCLIFQTSRWPFQRTNKVLKMQVLSSCERQLGHSPPLLQSSHRGVCAANKFRAVRQMYRAQKGMFSCYLSSYQISEIYKESVKWPEDCEWELCHPTTTACMLTMAVRCGIVGASVCHLSLYLDLNYLTTGRCC